MTQFRDSKCVWLAGASVLAMGLLAPAAIAQEEENTRTLSTVTVTTQKVEIDSGRSDRRFGVR